MAAEAEELGHGSLAGLSVDLQQQAGCRRPGGVAGIEDEQQPVLSQGHGGRQAQPYLALCSLRPCVAAGFRV